MRTLITLSIVLALAPVGANAQDNRAPSQEPVKGCVLNPSPDCRYFGVTDIGLAFGPRLHGTFYTNDEDIGQRITLEGGAMRTFMGRNAGG